MDRSLYRPTLRQAIGLAVIAAIALTYGFVMRYVVIQNSVIGIGCETASSWLCTGRHATIVLFQQHVFGIAALAAALFGLPQGTLPTLTRIDAPVPGWRAEAQGAALGLIGSTWELVGSTGYSSRPLDVDGDPLFAALPSTAEYVATTSSASSGIPRPRANPPATTSGRANGPC